MRTPSFVLLPGDYLNLETIAIAVVVAAAVPCYLLIINVETSLSDVAKRVSACGVVQINKKVLAMAAISQVQLVNQRIDGASSQS